MPKAKPLESLLPVVRVPKAMADRLAVEAFDKNAPLARVVRDRLAHSFAVEGKVLPMTPRDNSTQRKLDIEVQLREFELARLKGKLIVKDDALEVMVADAHATKQFFEHLPGDLPNATDEQRAWLKAEVEKTFANMVATWSARLQAKADELAAQKSV